MFYSEMSDLLYPEPAEDNPICWCDRCGEGIYRDEKFIEFNGERICEGCCDSFLVSDWLELYQIEVQTATEDIFE